MDSTWILDVETSINAIVKTKAKAILKSTYADINFTMDDAVSEDPVFPTVYIHFLPSVEYGADLIGQDINAILSTVQVEITVSKDQGLNGARNVASVVLQEFKKLAFNMVSAPEFVGNTTDTKRLVFRCRRMIGANDTF